METMIPPFETVVNYRHCRLRYTDAVRNVNYLRVMYRIKSQIDCLHPTKGTFD